MNTITIDRSEYDRLVADSELLADIRAYDATMGTRDDGMPMEVFRRIIDGENPVRVIREWRGLAQAELARKAGIHRVQVHDIETGKSRGSVDTLKAVAEALGVAMDDVV
jgi:DNA-binding XRE family transcriptional regulator